MKFAFIAKSIWPVAWLYEALGVSRSRLHAWLTRARRAEGRKRTRSSAAKVRVSFIANAGTRNDRLTGNSLLRPPLAPSCSNRLVKQGLRAHYGFDRPECRVNTGAKTFLRSSLGSGGVVRSPGRGVGWCSRARTSPSYRPTGWRRSATAGHRDCLWISCERARLACMQAPSFILTAPTSDG